MKVRKLSLVLVTLLCLAFFPGLAMGASNPAPPPAFQTLTHLGVKPSNLVKISTLTNLGDVIGWTILRGDGTITDYRTDTNPLVVPAGQILVVTDVFNDAFGGGLLRFSLAISKTVDGTPVTQDVYRFQSESGVTTTFKDHMTTGFFVPSGWQLNEPVDNATNPFAKFIRLQGYFTSAQ